MSDVMVQLFDIITIGVVRIIVKGQVAHQHGVKNHAAAPNVSRFTVISLAAIEKMYMDC